MLLNDNLMENEELELTMETLVEIKSLSKSFGQFHAVSDISFNVGKGEVLGFLGPNGAGKSTTMRMAMGFLEPTAGKITICGKDISEQPVESRAHIGYLPEGGPLYSDMTPAAFLKFIGNVRGLKSNALNERLEFVVDKLQISGVYHKTIDTLSKGYKRRVALAQAILHNPDVLILDEPTDGLDPNQKYEVRELIRDMAAEKAIVISTHILEEVEAVCTRNVVIAGGKLVAQGTTAELSALSPDHNAIVVELTNEKTDIAGLEAKLKKLSTTESVRQHNAHSLLVVPKGNKEILNDVRKVATGSDVANIYKYPGQLESAFRSITQPKS